MSRLSVAFSLLLLSFFLSCQREVSFVGGADTPTFIGEAVTPEPITAALQGNVFDEAGAPAAGVTVQAGNKIATTNGNGYFRINDAALDKKSAMVTATKAGYFKGYRTFAATSGANNVEIKLVKRAAAGNVDAATGGEVSLPNGSKVALSANGVVNATTGAVYTGSVKIYAMAIDPTTADIAQTIPGSFMATDKDGKRVTLSSYGMTAVELEGAGGEKLQIKSGSTAKLTTAIPSSVQASAPATIALWSVDETTGIWKEEGAATKSGNTYVGDVKHFSFWNCDVSANAVVLSMTLKTNDGNPLVHAHVTLKRQNANWVVHGYTDSLGQVSGYVPYNETLLMEVLDQCNTAFYSQAVGPLEQATNLGVISLNNTGTSVVTVKGKLLDCNNAAVANGYALVTFGYTTHYASVNIAGDFQTTFIRCAGGPASFTVIGIDNTAQQGGASATVTLSSPVTNAGNVSACGNSISQFFNYTLDGASYAISSTTAGSVFNAYTTNDSLQTTSVKLTFLSAQQTTSSNQMNFDFTHQNSAPGTYSLSRLIVQNYNTSAGPVHVTLISPSNVVLTTFAQNAGQFYEGSINSTFKDSLNTTHSLTGTFKILRR